MQNIGISKAVGTYNFFFENRAEILVKTISKICTLSITFVTFPNACKVLRLKPVFKKEKKQPHLKIIYNIITNLDSELIIELTYASYFGQITL